MKWFNLSSISTRLLILIGVIPILMTALIVFTFFSLKDLQRVSLTNIEQSMLKAHQVKVKALATSMAATLAETLKNIEDQKEREAYVRRIINPIRFFPNHTGYYFAYRMDGTRIALPTAPHLVGRNSFKEKPPAPAQMHDFISKAKKGGGFSQWYWGKPGKKGKFLKQGYVAPIAGTDLILLTAVYIDDIETEKAAVGTRFDHALKDTVTWSIVAVVLILFGVLPLLIIFVQRGVLSPIRKVTTVAKAIADGDFSSEFPHSTLNEMRDMVQAFKQMVHQRKKAEENAFNRQLFLSSILSHVPDAIISLDAQYKVVDWNPGAEKLFGYNREETIGIDLDYLVAKGDTYDEARGFTRNILAGETLRPMDVVRHCRDGSPVNVIASGTPIYSNENLQNVVVVYTDITDRKLTIQKLMDSEEKFSKTFNFSPDAITVSLIETGELIEVNQGFVDMFGYAKDESIGTTTAELGLHANPSDRLRMIELIKRDGRIRNCEIVGTTKSGSTLITEISCEIMEISGKTCLTSIVRDITDRKKVEEMMIQSEKMLSVGGLAAGMAHEINNPLAGMMQTANVMSKRLTDLEIPANIRCAEEIGISMDDINTFMEKREIPRMVTTISESGRRVAEIVNNMLSFARKSELSVSSHDPVDLLDKILELAATEYDLKKQYDFKSIEILKEYEDNLPMVPCEGAKIQQVLLNILRNGAQAMQKTMKANSGKHPKFILRLSLATETNMLRIEIEDNGPGMDKKTRKRIFEPFFTTKPVGVGTGLGLSVSYFIITENHGGTIDVISEPGRGATFIINLPLENNGKINE